MSVSWDEELGRKCGETWASRGTTLSCAAARQAAQKLAADLKDDAARNSSSGKEYSRRVRPQLHDAARHAGSGAESDDAPDVQLFHAGGHSSTTRAS